MYCNKRLFYSYLFNQFLGSLIAGFLTPFLNQILHLLTKNEWSIVGIVVSTVPLFAYFLSKLDDLIIIKTAVIVDMVLVVFSIMFILKGNYRLFLITDAVFIALITVLYNLRYTVFMKKIEFFREPSFTGLVRTLSAIGSLMGAGLSYIFISDVKLVLFLSFIGYFIVALVSLYNNNLVLSLK